ncbi:MAG: peptidoglycan binding protein CsiV [Pseudomonadales bacterium]|nr:peptidoglycan binding protein CsiV [Pseudomonadales bacterium]
MAKINCHLPRFATFFLIFLTAVFTTVIPAAFGVENKVTQWYQIELYIFATDSELASHSEVWKDRSDLGIQYPLPLLELLDPNKTVPQQETTVTSTNHDFATEAYLKLPQNQHTMLKLKSRLSNSRHYRLLYQAAWRQPLEGRNNSTPILIQGGGQYDDYFELEGTVSLSVSRYLHIETDLWLSQFAQIVDLDDEFESAYAEPELDPLEDYSSTYSSTYSSEKPNSLIDNTGVNNEFSLSPPLQLIASNYEPVRTVQLKQSRRMRSRELHYLDHPLFGMIVKVIPYERPESVDHAEDFEQLPPWEQ